jgi:hypothetical protein
MPPCSSWARAFSRRSTVRSVSRASTRRWPSSARFAGPWPSSAQVDSSASTSRPGAPTSRPSGPSIRPAARRGPDATISEGCSARRHSRRACATASPARGRSSGWSVRVRSGGPLRTSGASSSRRALTASPSGRSTGRWPSCSRRGGPSSPRCIPRSFCGLSESRSLASPSPPRGPCAVERCCAGSAPMLGSISTRSGLSCTTGSARPDRVRTRSTPRSRASGSRDSCSTARYRNRRRRRGPWKRGRAPKSSPPSWMAPDGAVL